MVRYEIALPRGAAAGLLPVCIMSGPPTEVWTMLTLPRPADPSGE